MAPEGGEIAPREDGAGAPGRPPRRPDQLPGGHHGLTPEEVAESQRARVLEAMRATIAEQGYPKTSIAEAIKRAGVSRKTFYALFVDRDDCFVALYDEHMRRLLDLTLSAFDAQDEWVPSLRAALTVLLDALAHDPLAARVCFVEVLAAGPHAAERRTEAMAELRDILELDERRIDDADAGSAAASAPASPTALGRSLVGGLVEVLYQEINADRAEQLPRLLPDLMYTLVLPYQGPTAAERELERTPRRAITPPERAPAPS